MISASRRNLIFDTIGHISCLTSVSQIGATLADTMAKFGFGAMGINSLPPPGEGADPLILTENAPEGFRDLYIRERFYSVDHICWHARFTNEPFRYSEAPYERTQARDHQRFMQALQTFGMGRGLIVPVARPANIPTCIWLAGENPDLDDETTQASQLICLFSASKAHALSRSRDSASRKSTLTPREREVLRWISAGKTSWEIGVISRLSERAINKIIGDAMIKLDAVTRAQAVANAIRIGEIEM